MLRPLILASALVFATATGLQAQVQTTAQATPAAAPTVPVTPLPAVQKTLVQPNVVVLDVRTPEEYAAGHLSAAQNLNFRGADFAAQVAQLDRSKTYVLYCASGNRSGKAALLFQEQGFKNVLNAGAFKALQEGGVK